MSLKHALFESINDAWSEQYKQLTRVFVHDSLAIAIKNEGEEVPYAFEPFTFNALDEDDDSPIEIIFQKQKTLIEYEYE